MVARRDRSHRTRALIRAWAVATPLAALVSLGACELATENVAPPAPQIVVHAVLNPDEFEQVILVESSLTGRVTIDSTLRFDPLDPVRSAGGEPIAGADVRVFAEGDTVGVRANESSSVSLGYGAGRYSLDQLRLPILPGRRYRLRVQTPDGRVVTGETKVPSAEPGWVRGDGRIAQTVALNRTRDTLQLTWPAVPDARTYAVRVDTPYGPWFLFSDSTRFSLAGSLRNFFSSGLPSVWFPGFEQVASVLAVDQNFYDYNRSGNDPFSGSGLISSVQGGLGLFGSTLNLLRRRVRVTDDLRFPLDGVWAGVTLSGRDVNYDLWVETQDTPRSSVSGLVRAPEVQVGQSLLGTIQGDQVRLVTLLGLSSIDTASYFTGQLVGDTIRGTYDERFQTGGARVLVRVPGSAP